MRTTTITLCATALFTGATLTAGCSDDPAPARDDAPEAQAQERRPSAKPKNRPAAASAKPSAPRELTAPALFDDYSRLKGMEPLDRYRDGLVVSGKVKRTILELDKSTKVWLDAGDGRWISLGFADQGAAVVARKVKAGDELRAGCKVGGMSGKYILVIDCALL